MRAAFLALASLALLGQAAPAPAACLGDCNADDRVEVSELVALVGRALGQDGTTCTQWGQPSIDTLIGAVARALTGCPPPLTRDFSAATRIELLYGPGYGFCPDDGQVLAASVRREGDGSWVLKRTHVRAGVAGRDRCLLSPFAYGEACPLAAVEPCRTLTAEEVTRLQNALAAVRFNPAPAGGCVIADPCLVARATFDGASFSNYANGPGGCLGERLDAAPLQALFASFGAGAERDCPTGLCGAGNGRLCNDGNTDGGDGCAADCSEERVATCRFTETRSALQLQTPAFPYIFAFNGEQTLRLGAGDGGRVPVAVRGDELRINPVLVPGVGCLCLRPAAAPVVAQGFLGCAGAGDASADYLAQQDGDTTPASAGNAGGLADDAECDDATTLPSGRALRACRAGVDPHCGTRSSGACRGPQVITVAGDGERRDATLVEYDLRLTLLDDGGACGSGNVGEDGACAVHAYGPDCRACTDDDLPPAQHFTALLTTGRAEAELYDADQLGLPVDITGAQSCLGAPCATVSAGAPFDCAALPDVARGVLAAAWPAPDLGLAGDGVATLSIACQ